jgi:hypothetical protein
MYKTKYLEYKQKYLNLKYEISQNAGSGFSTPQMENEYISPEVRAANRAHADQVYDWARQHDPNPGFSTPQMANEYISPEVRAANRAHEDQVYEWARQQALEAQRHETPSQRNERIAREQREAQRQIALAENRRIDAQRQAELRANDNRQNPSASQWSQPASQWDQQEAQRRRESQRQWDEQEARRRQENKQKTNKDEQENKESNKEVQGSCMI